MPHPMPLAARAANTLGAVLARVGPHAPPRLEPDLLLDAAGVAADAAELGAAPAIRPALDVLAPSLKDEADLSFTGRTSTRARMLRILRRRLRHDRDLREHPEIETVPIDRPLIVVGMPRSGTTLLQNLLAALPGARWLRPWEIDGAWPESPGAGTEEGDPRAAAHRLLVERRRRALPALDRQHPFDSPAECNDLFAATLRSNRFTVFWNTPSYTRWLGERRREEWAAAYRHYRSQLRRLLWRFPGECWVLKSPHHLGHLETLVETLPSARILHLHRSPRRVMGSLCSHVASLRALSARRVDRAEVGRFLMATLPETAERSLGARDRLARQEQRDRPGRANGGPDHRIVDVAFSDLVADPIATVSKAFEELGEPLDGAAEAALRARLAEQERKGHGRHRYRLADFGLTPEEVDRRFERYGMRFSQYLS